MNEEEGYIEEPSTTPLIAYFGLLLIYIATIMLSLWQINIAVDCLMNGWNYAFGPFKFYGLGVYYALDLWYWCIFFSSFGISILAILLGAR